MKDKYLIVYQNSANVLRKITVSEKDLSERIEIIIERQGEIITVSKIMVQE